MKIVVCDITGRTINYDAALCDAIDKELTNGDTIEFWSAGITEDYAFKCHIFRSIVPKRYRSVAHRITRVLKAFDTILAYIWILYRIKKDKIDILHLQWFPFISLGLTGAFIDIKFLSLVKKYSPATRLVFTIHNMCPHRMSEDERQYYNPTFIRALQYFDAYVVHTEETRDEANKVLGLPLQKIFVIYHGIFAPSGYKFKPSKLNKNRINLLMYGFQHPYKGTDVFVKALSLLTEIYKERIHVTICGAFGNGYLDKCQTINTGIKINWVPEFLSDDDLYKEIDNADILFFPYRRISQSGALLLALYTNKYLITSDLPTFVETLKGYPKEAFFQSENPNDLARVIELFITEKIDQKAILESISSLNLLYSWNQSALSTLRMYNIIK